MQSANRQPSHAAAPGRGRLAPLLSVAALVLLGFAILLTTKAGGPVVMRRVDDLGQAAGGALASIGCGRAAWRSRGRLRASWASIAVGTAGWTAGQLVWSYYELIRDTSTPFPSLADAGYLLFPVGAALGLWLFPSADGVFARGRWALDAGTVVSALVTVSWVTTLGATAHAGGDSAFAFGVSLAYPIGDILVLTMAVTGVVRPNLYRGQLGLLSAAMVSMAIADSSFTYLTATGRYQTGSPADIGWVGSFLLLAVAGTYGARTRSTSTPAVSTRGAAVTMLPYVPLLVAGAVLAIRAVQNASIGRVELASISVSLFLVLLRQYITVRENRALLDALAAREEQLERQAFHDPLTGLANRALFLDRLRLALDLHARDGRTIGVLLCDLDDFKTVNDTLGHGAGDTLLTLVAERLTAVLRPGDTLARLGGDEFAVLLQHGDEVEPVASRLVEALATPLQVAGQDLALGMSVGTTTITGDDPTPDVDALLAQADIAMYVAKRAGKGQHSGYQASMQVPQSEDLRLRAPLLAAVEANEIFLVFQPIFYIDSGEILGFEALSRWNHEGQPVPPDRFIGVIARAGLMRQFTDQVLDGACAQLAAWNAVSGHRRIRVGVNVAPELLIDLDFPNRVAAVVRRYGLGPDQLVLEITEEALLADPASAAQVTRRLREIGTRLSLDDFGKGYSSLLHLQRIPLNSMKIDREFVTRIDVDPEAERFAGALLALGRDLRLDVVAEGIERRSQLESLRRIGGTFGQGYLFSRPLPAADAVELIVSGRRLEPPPVLGIAAAS